MTRLRRFRKTGFWMVGGFLLLVLAADLILSWRYGVRAEAVARQMSARGYPESVDEIYAKHNGSASGSNGVASLKRAISLINESGVNFDLLPFEWPLSPGPVPPESMREVQALLAQNEQSLELAAAAARADAFLYPLAPNVSDPIPMNEFAGWRQIARLLSFESLERTESGDVAGAMDAIETALLLGERGSRQPTEFAFLAGNALVNTGQAAALTLLERGYLTEPAQFDRLIGMLERVEPADPIYALWCDGLLSERPIALRTTPRKTIGGIARSIDPRKEMFEFIEPTLYRRTPVGELDRLASRRTILAMAELMKTPGITMLDKVQKAKELRPAPGAFDALRVLSSRWSFNSASGIMWITAMTQARLDTAATAARVLNFRRENGRLPDKTEYATVIALRPDPFNGESLGYRVDEEGFAISSVGINDLTITARIRLPQNKSEIN